MSLHTDGPASQSLGKGLFSYTSQYCEENVWKLCENVKKSLTVQKTNSPADIIWQRSFTVFISNSEKKVPIWCQNASRKLHENEDYPVVWDYHVIFIAPSQLKNKVTIGNPKVIEDMNLRSESYDVWDLDSYLPFPCSFEDYSAKALRKEDTIKPKYRRKFRIVSAGTYLSTFASNRGHMKAVEPDGSVRWLADPPSYPAIRTADCEHNLDTFWSMDPTVGIGTVVDLQGLWSLFVSK